MIAIKSKEGDGRLCRPDGSNRQLRSRRRLSQTRTFVTEALTATTIYPNNHNLLRHEHTKADPHRHNQEAKRSQRASTTTLVYEDHKIARASRQLIGKVRDQAHSPRSATHIFGNTKRPGCQNAESEPKVQCVEVL